MKPKITVLGWYDKKNCGDESYKLSFPKIFPDYDFRFTDTLTPAIVENSDGFILGGGDILAPSMVGQFDQIKKPKHIISATASNQSVHPDKLKGFQSIIVRDYHSIELLQEKGVKPTWLPDAAMVLRGNPETGKKKIKEQFQKYDYDLYEKVVVVVLNSYLLQVNHPECQTRDFIDFLDFAHDFSWVCDNTPASFVFLPFGYRMPFDDRITNSWVAARCKFWQKNCVVYDELDVQTTIDIMSAADAIVSSRLHSSILSCANGVPFLDITWSHKNRWFLETIGMTRLSLPYRTMNAEECRDQLHHMIFHGESTREQLEAIAKKQTSIIMNSTKFVLAEVKPEPKPEVKVEAKPEPKPQPPVVDTTKEKK